MPPVKPHIISLPNTFPESFPSDQPYRGNATWKTLFSSALSAGVASCPPLSAASCPSSVFPSSAALSSSTTYAPGSLVHHKHSQPELYHILSGQGIVEISGIQYEVKPGMTLFIPGDAEHAVLNRGQESLRWLYVFPGEFEQVVYRFRGDGYEDETGVKARL
jgi:mannose-6-phosphate isomerase-like protein (cupin superfamily)